MTMFNYTGECWLPRPRDEVFAFFSDPGNLQTITPSWLHFQILTPAPILMRPGTLIDYQLRIRGIPVRWQTQITVWQPPDRFVDMQRRGPYLQWIHEHRFLPSNGGTHCFDSVEYAVPGGRLVHRLFVKRDVDRIFQFRADRLKEIFRPAA